MILLSQNNLYQYKSSPELEKLKKLEEGKLDSNFQSVNILDIKKDEYIKINMPLDFFNFFKCYPTINFKNARRNLQYSFVIDGEAYVGYEMPHFVVLVKVDSESDESHSCKNETTNIHVGLSEKMPNKKDLEKFRENNQNENLCKFLKAGNVHNIFNLRDKDCCDYLNNNGYWNRRREEHRNEEIKITSNFHNVDCYNDYTSLFKIEENDYCSDCYYVYLFNSYFFVIFDESSQKLIISIFSVEKYGFDKCKRLVFKLSEHEDFIRKIIQQKKAQTNLTNLCKSVNEDNSKCESFFFDEPPVGKFPSRNNSPNVLDKFIGNENIINFPQALLIRENVTPSGSFTHNEDIQTGCKCRLKNNNSHIACADKKINNFSTVCVEEESLLQTEKEKIKISNSIISGVSEFDVEQIENDIDKLSPSRLTKKNNNSNNEKEEKNYDIRRNKHAWQIILSNFARNNFSKHDVQYIILLLSRIGENTKPNILMSESQREDMKFSWRPHWIPCYKGDCTLLHNYISELQRRLPFALLHDSACEHSGRKKEKRKVLKAQMQRINKYFQIKNCWLVCEKNEKNWEHILENFFTNYFFYIRENKLCDVNIMHNEYAKKEGKCMKRFFRNEKKKDNTYGCIGYRKNEHNSSEYNFIEYTSNGCSGNGYNSNSDNNGSYSSNSDNNGSYNSNSDNNGSYNSNNYNDGSSSNGGNSNNGGDSSNGGNSNNGENGSNGEDSNNNGNNNNGSDNNENDDPNENDDSNENEDSQKNEDTNENEEYNSNNENNSIDNYKFVDKYSCMDIESKKFLTGELLNSSKYTNNTNKSEISTNYFENSCNISASNSNNGFYEENNNLYLNNEDGLTLISVQLQNDQRSSVDEGVMLYDNIENGNNLDHQLCNSDNVFNNISNYMENYIQNNNVHVINGCKRDFCNINEEQVPYNYINDSTRMKEAILYSTSDLVYNRDGLNVKDEMNDAYEPNCLSIKRNSSDVDHKLLGAGVQKKINKKRNKVKMEKSNKNLEDEKKEVLNKVSQITRVGGVCFDKNRQRWIAHWKIDGKYHKHYFPISQYGFENARERAINCRKQAEKLFNLPEIQPRNRWNQIKVHGTSHIKKVAKLPRCEGVAYDELSQSWVSTFVVHKKFSIDDLGFYEARDQAIYCRKVFEKINAQDDYEILLKDRLGMSNEEKEELDVFFNIDKNALEKLDMGKNVGSGKAKNNAAKIKVKHNNDFSLEGNNSENIINGNTNADVKISNEQYLKITQEAIEMILSNIKHKSLPEIKLKLIDTQKFENYNTLLDKHFKFITSVKNISQLQPYISLFHKFIIYHTLPHNISLRKQLFIIEALEWSSFFSGAASQKID
ncbi:transcription factor with AP2 domain(s) [Plasmodium gonderi]|uniref:Transcription factor with AP2 domain(S) n=1 Tax=Plasmodium gonderi TaxID=77519 RepID=A0A1Y1JD89_PLAGO|nr:transcription factor with AP2 domain(s) [Plasmodium gonderi]GAW79187.1 transcription factor with AP2 domain(s) [Plasmodium gonderi]